MSCKKHARLIRHSTIEALEARQVMTADLLSGLLGGTVVHHGIIDDEPELVQHAQVPAPVHHDQRDADFWLDPENGYNIHDSLGDVEQTLNSAHQMTGLDTVRTNYGFTGIGQTVAVIDSGIAYDHYALGGGYGTNYRVIGGWDFTEGDANPYDDGTEGSHGTHVAGIIGSSGDTNGNNVGVSPSADLVGLRVFDDAGNGSFGWVEDALQWVIDNRLAFENPITTVNLSLGTTWNSASPPAWAMLENEFYELEQAGVFITVSAGNSFTDYNSPGFSYPAASPFVVPVMSVDDSGSLSYFSQRHTNGIAAPGRYIRSTIPDYAGNNNGSADDWANFSGTSMAAPYVAGASVLIREAMELVGYTGITQDVIYEHMRETADLFFDSATSETYHRLNLSAAFDALMPEDDYGSTVGAAHLLGTIDADSQLSGMISTLDDADYFTFTAGATGVARFSATTTHHLDCQWDMGDADAWQEDGGWVMNVVAGETYTIGMSSSDGLGYYDMDLAIEPTFSFTDWGDVVGQQTHNGMSSAGESWYRIVAGQRGYMTAQAAFANAAGNVDIAFYNSDMELVGQSNTSGNAERIDYLAEFGEELYLQVTGTNSDIDLQLTNMVSVVGSTLSVAGTSSDDVFSFVAGTTHQMAINDVTYRFAGATVDSVVFDAQSGHDSVTITGGVADELALVHVGSAQLIADAYEVTATSAESLVLHSGGGYDQVVFYDSTGDEWYVGRSDRATFGGTGYRFDAVDYSNSLVHSNGGYDKATFYDTAGDEWYLGMATRVRFGGAGFHHDVRNFESTLANSTGGNDSATLYDTDADDVYVAWANRAIMAGDGYHNDTRGFYRNLAYATGGYDFATFYDTGGDDSYVTWRDRAILAGAGYFNDSRGFERTRAYSTSGNDTATFYDTAGDDNYIGQASQATMMSSTYRHDGYGFDNYAATATGGHDKATFYDSSGNDTYNGYHNRAKMWGDGYYHNVTSFDRTVAFASTGYDQATFFDSAGDDAYVAWDNRALMAGTGFFNDVRGFDRTTAFSSSGNDTATFYDSAGNETYTAWSNRALMSGSGFVNDTRGFATTKAYATGGYDRAVLYDTVGDDDFHAMAWGAFMTDGAYINQAEGFDRVDAYRESGGNDEATIDSIDYLFNLIGDWV